MSDKEYLDKALDLIVEVLKDDPTFVCDVLHDIPEEEEICARECENFDRFCLLRYLKYHKKDEKGQ